LRGTNSGIIYWKERGTWHKRRFSDIDMEKEVNAMETIRIGEAGNMVRLSHAEWNRLLELVRSGKPPPVDQR
jgi:hypothetical protein